MLCFKLLLLFVLLLLFFVFMFYVNSQRSVICNNSKKQNTNGVDLGESILLIKIGSYSKRLVYLVVHDAYSKLVAINNINDNTHNKDNDITCWKGPHYQ